MQPMEVLGVRVELPTNVPVVLLREVVESGRLLPIFIGTNEATAIALAVDGVSTPRPMTHDLLRDVIAELSATVERVVVTDLVDRTFHAELHLVGEAGPTVVSCRPSDAIALAVRTGAAIYAAESVITEAGYRADGAPTGRRKDQDDKEIEKEWKAFIEDVKPEDFEV